MAIPVLSTLASIPKPALISSASALLAYLNAKYAISADLWMAYQGIALRLWMKRVEKTDRTNLFYQLESRAQDAKSASHTFLAVPVETAPPGQQTAWTYAEAYETVLKYAAWLRETHGVQKGEMIAMDFTNKPQFVWIWFAIWSLGAVPAFINHNLRDNAFVHCVRISTARLLFMDPAVSDTLNDNTRKALSADEKGRATDVVILDPATEQQINTVTPYRAPDSARSGALISSTALLIYTSGTTGLPKAAKVAWMKPLYSLRLWPVVLGLKATDRYFTALPLYHSSGSILGVCVALGTGCTVVVAPKFSPHTYSRLLVATEATAMQYIGEMCRYLVTSPPSPHDANVRVRVAFGNGMRPDVWPKFVSRFGIDTVVEFYAATEAPAATFVRSRNDYLLGTVGRQGLLIRTLLSQNVLVRHDHETDAPYRDPRTGFCVKCDNDETGELLHPLDPATIGEKYQGYWGNEDASSSKVLRGVFKKGDVYYRTGDLQRRDAEGRWFFMDRVGDTYRWKSENVSTAEVSTALSTHPAIHEANVYGVELPGHDGRAGCAAILLNPSHPDTTTKETSEERLGTLNPALARDLVAHCRQRLPRYAVPVFLRILRPGVEEEADGVSAPASVVDVRSDSSSSSSGATTGAGGRMQTTGTLKQLKSTLRAEGVNPGVVLGQSGDKKAKEGGEELWWLPPGKTEAYERFGERQWGDVVGGRAKL